MRPAALGVPVSGQGNHIELVREQLQQIMSDIAAGSAQGDCRSPGPGLVLRFYSHIPGFICSSGYVHV
ncbi:hypothetical protein D3C75_1058230 [compost metagenome]